MKSAGLLGKRDKNKLTENTKKVLQQLQDNNHFLKPTKCEFNKIKVEYLVIKGPVLWTANNRNLDRTKTGKDWDCSPSP